MPFCRDCGYQIYGSDTYCNECEEDIIESARNRIKYANASEQRRIKNDKEYAHDWIQDTIGWIVNLMGIISGITTGCYITSSVVKYLNLSDNGVEMNTFRYFRKQYILEANNKKRLEDLEEYYIVGQQIRNWINSRQDSDIIWEYVSQYTLEFLDMINNGMYDEAYLFFKSKTLNIQKVVLLNGHIS